MARDFTADADQAAAPLRGAVAGAIAVGRYEGTVKRESDDATFLRAIEIGAQTDSKIPFEAYEQLGGSIPPTPQHAGTALAFGSIIFFSASDSVADRKYVSLVFGDFMISIKYFGFPR